MAKAKKKGELDIPTHIMDDLCSRFIINSDRKLDPVHIFDILESAHWHYIDFYCVQMKPPPPKCSHKIFSKHVMLYLSELNHMASDFDSHFLTWQNKKRGTPIFGGIILTPGYTHVLMVLGFGNKTSWGFPKGKKELGETGINCAIREIEEETGLDVREKIQEDMSIVCWLQDRFHKLYIIPDVSVDVDIQAKLRREIKAHKWMPVHSLPVHKNDTAPQQADLDVSNFFNVIAFVRPLRKWIEEQKNREQQQAMPASQFTAKGRRRGKGKDAQRRQGGPGPDGDASTSRDVARNLGDQFNDMGQGSLAVQQVRLQDMEEGVWRSVEGQQDRHEDAGLNTGTSGHASENATGCPQLRLDEFHSKAMLNFKFDTKSILDIFRW